MKATLSFNLPDDEAAFRLANKASDYAAALWDIAQWLRHQLKYNDTAYTEDQQKTLESVREMFFGQLESHGVSLDDIP